MAIISTRTGIKLIRNCSCGGKALFSMHSGNSIGKIDVSIECIKCGSIVSTEFEDVININPAIDRTIERWNNKMSERIRNER